MLQNLVPELAVKVLIHPSNKDNKDKMSISCEGNQETSLITNAQGRRQRGGVDDADLWQVDRRNLLRWRTARPAAGGFMS
jgi:hypothetical protein